MASPSRVSSIAFFIFDVSSAAFAPASRLELERKPRCRAIWPRTTENSASLSRRSCASARRRHGVTLSPSASSWTRCIASRSASFATPASSPKRWRIARTFSMRCGVDESRAVGRARPGGRRSLVRRSYRPAARRNNERPRRRCAERRRRVRRRPIRTTQCRDQCQARTRRQLHVTNVHFGLLTVDARCATLTLGNRLESHGKRASWKLSKDYPQSGNRLRKFRLFTQLTNSNTAHPSGEGAAPIESPAGRTVSPACLRRTPAPRHAPLPPRCPTGSAAQPCCASQARRRERPPRQS